MKNTGKSIDIYERLANALEALPAGFARTKSGVEIKLIKLAFTEEEVRLAGQLSIKFETAAEIAERTGLDEARVTELLESMAVQRKVRDNAGKLETGIQGLGGLGNQAAPVKKYRLNGYLVGWYEAMMRLTGKEFAELFEQYVIEGGGEKILAPRPGPQGIVPYRGSLKPEWLKREPYNDIDAHFQRHERFLVLDCVCKYERGILGDESCEMPIKRCAFVGMPPQAPLSENVLDREEAIKLFNEIEAMGTMVHQSFYGFTVGADSPQFVGGCNCCGCCCGIMRPGRTAKLKEDVQRSNYRAVKDYEKCKICGECRRRCQYFAHTKSKTKGGKPDYDRAKCVGCGSCVMGCPSGALRLEPVSEDEWYHVPADFFEWEERRLQYLAGESEKTSLSKGKRKPVRNAKQ